MRLLRQRPFRCLSQPVTTPESKFTKCRVSKSVFEERSKIVNGGSIVGKKYTVDRKEIAKARPSPVNVSDATTSRPYGWSNYILMRASNIGMEDVSLPSAFLLFRHDRNR
jgi:hypothetical protein